MQGCFTPALLMQGDQQDIASAAAEERSDRIVKARLQLARTDSLRTLSMSHALQAAAKAAASQCGEQNLLQVQLQINCHQEALIGYGSDDMLLFFMKKTLFLSQL